MASMRKRTAKNKQLPYLDDCQPFLDEWYDRRPHCAETCPICQQCGGESSTSPKRMTVVRIPIRIGIPTSNNARNWQK